MPPPRTLIHDKISQCDAQEWDEIVRASNSGVLMSPQFVAAVEEAFEHEARFAHAVLYDEGRAAACAGFCASRSTWAC